MLKASVLLAVIVALLEIVFSQIASSSILETKHNLSVSSQFTVKSDFETRICVFCHTPHNAKPGVPLWGHTSTTPTGGYTPYQSSTMEASSAQPDGTSKLCLSCHDGTIAVGSLLGQPISMAGVDADGSLSDTAVTNLGTNLSNDHPVSIKPIPGAEIQNPPLGSTVRLDQNGKVQCTSCHDAHGTELGKFLVKSISYGALCNECHNKTGWFGSAHEQADKEVTIEYWHEGSAQTKVINVRERSCLICHSMHSSLNLNRLMRNEEPAPADYDQRFDTEEWVCLVCHDGNTASNIESAMFGWETVSRHDTAALSGAHDAKEEFSSLQVAGNRHVECSDCHEPHQVRSGLHLQAETSGIGPTLNGTWGVKPDFPLAPWTPLASTDFTKVSLSNYGLTPGVDSFEAYLCLKCHPEVARDFNVNNPMIHNVFGLAVVPNTAKFRENDDYFKPDLGYVGSDALLPQPDLGPSPYGPYGPDTKLTCTDCHATNSDLGGQGPHGSIYGKILQRPGPTDLAAGADYHDLLCFKCHLSNCYAYFTSDYNKYTEGAEYTNFHNDALPYNPDGWNVHVKKHGTKGWNCFLCHSTTVAHGFKRKRGIVYVTDGPPYYNTILAGENIDINGVDHGENGIYGYRDPRSVGRDYYIKDDCWAGCHYYSRGILTGQPIHPFKEEVQYEP